jgi:hypothetical protein
MICICEDLSKEACSHILTVYWESHLAVPNSHIIIWLASSLIEHPLNPRLGLSVSGGSVREWGEGGTLVPLYCIMPFHRRRFFWLPCLYINDKITAILVSRLLSSVSNGCITVTLLRIYTEAIRRGIFLTVRD